MGLINDTCLREWDTRHFQVRLTFHCVPNVFLLATTRGGQGTLANSKGKCDPCAEAGYTGKGVGKSWGPSLDILETYWPAQGPIWVLS